MNGPNTISCLVDREVTLHLGADGKLYPSHPDMVADILPALKEHRTLALEYAQGDYFPSVQAIEGELKEQARLYAEIDARYPRHVVMQALLEKRIFRTNRGCYALHEF